MLQMIVLALFGLWRTFVKLLRSLLLFNSVVNWFICRQWWTLASAATVKL